VTGSPLWVLRRIMAATVPAYDVSSGPALSVWGVERPDVTYYDVELEGGSLRYEEHDLPGGYWPWARSYFVQRLTECEALLPKLTMELARAEAAAARRQAPEMQEKILALRSKYGDLRRQREEAERKVSHFATAVKDVTQSVARAAVEGKSPTSLLADLKNARQAKRGWSVRVDSLSAEEYRVSQECETFDARVAASESALVAARSEMDRNAAMRRALEIKVELWDIRMRQDEWVHYAMSRGRDTVFSGANEDLLAVHAPIDLFKMVLSHIPCERITRSSLQDFMRVTVALRWREGYSAYRSSGSLDRLRYLLPPLPAA
jgi:hypothetical protein